MWTAIGQGKPCAQAGLACQPTSSVLSSSRSSLKSIAMKKVLDISRDIDLRKSCYVLESLNITKQCCLGGNAFLRDCEEDYPVSMGV